MSLQHSIDMPFDSTSQQSALCDAQSMKSLQGRPHAWWGTSFSEEHHHVREGRAMTRSGMTLQRPITVFQMHPPNACLFAAFES